ncbi:MarR family winged helix-turn-helix transcriptional regulator [Actinophytocola glycyrrhizae]|uniref:MarR family winged helix-turn-helix transcriptional regulator n=1 Tax=Actinophytocola glycyrrhizae TaxID=2044873 RepID=A0ABV9RWK4_9PSEU
MDAENVTRLRRVIGRLARLLNAAPVSENLTPTQASVLGIVAHRGPIGMTELADIEGLNPTMLSRVVAKLVDDGLATRLPNPADQRAVQIATTDAGQDVHLRIIKSRTETVARILDGLSPDVTDALLDALPALEALAEGLRTTKN